MQQRELIDGVLSSNRQEQQRNSLSITTRCTKTKSRKDRHCSSGKQKTPSPKCRIPHRSLAKIQRNFEVSSPCDFIARLTQHIPDKSFQLVRYYGWYSNKMHGHRLKQTDAGPVEVLESEVMDVSAYKPRPILSKKWRELIQKVW